METQGKLFVRFFFESHYLIYEAVAAAAVVAVVTPFDAVNS